MTKKAMQTFIAEIADVDLQMFQLRWPESPPAPSPVL